MSSPSPALGQPRDQRCPADPRCRSTPCFRVRLHSAPDEAEVVKTANTCADHLGDTVQALSGWATASGFAAGQLQVWAIGPSPAPDAVGTVGADSPVTAFLFASIPLAP
jgi:hypothetical protein